MSMENKEKMYIDFASKISYFEFIQDEFHEPSFNIEEYQEEIDVLEKNDNWNANAIEQILIKYPRVFELFEIIFQYRRFTNAQLIHFLFDTKILNYGTGDDVLQYLERNIRLDNNFRSFFLKELKKDHKIGQKYNNLSDMIKDIQNASQDFKNRVIFIFKATINSYIKAIEYKNRDILHRRMKQKEFRDIAQRIAKYLIDNQYLDHIIKGIRIREYLQNKRKARDTKSIHGNFGKKKLSEILNNNGFLNADESFNKLNITTVGGRIEKIEELDKLKEKYIYVTERYLEDIKVRGTHGLKKFDFILFYNLKPRIAIETNFYSTSGTKIGINRDEYIRLDRIFKDSEKNIAFFWVSDGNFWLSATGKSMFNELIDVFGSRLLNYKTFDSMVKSYKG